MGGEAKKGHGCGSGCGDPVNVQSDASHSTGFQNNAERIQWVLLRSGFLTSSIVVLPPTGPGIVVRIRDRVAVGQIARPIPPDFSP